MRETTNRFAEPPTVRLKTGALEAKARSRNWTTAAELARALRISPPSLSRLLNEDEAGKPLQMPGETFIAAVLAAFPESKFEDFFELVPAKTTLRCAS
jgi:hypothetical protein